MEFNGGTARWQVGGPVGSPRKKSWRKTALSAAVNAVTTAVFGGIILMMGSSIHDTGEALKGGVVIDGEVVATPFSESGSGTCTKVVRYLVNGVAYQVRSSVGTSSDCGGIGKTMRVSYLPGEPGTARVVDSTTMWFVRIVQIVGGGFLVVSALLVVTAVRRATTTDAITGGETTSGDPSSNLSGDVAGYERSRPNGWSGNKVGGAVMVALGVTFLVVGFTTQDDGDALKGGVTIDGQVVATPSSGRGRACTKNVEYAVDGVTYQVQTAVGSSSTCGQTGKTIQVSYLPDNPSAGRVVDSSASSAGHLFQFMGAGMLVLAVLSFRSGGRRPTTTDADSARGTTFGDPSSNLSGLQFPDTSASGGPLGGAASGPSSLPPPPLPPPVRAPSPGWYLDPIDEAVQRWWDGREWTEHRR